MSDALFSIGVIVIFSIIGGFFAAAETALVTLRDSQIARLATTKGRRGQRLANLTANPNRFLAAVQVGVTFTGFISAGYGSAKIVPVVSPVLVDLGLSAGVAETISFIAVTILIAYISLVIGELVPKRIALQKTEGVALNVSGFVDLLAKFTRPFIWLLSVSTNVLVRMLGLDPATNKETISNEELRRLVASHTGFSQTERELIDDVFAAGERDLREVMIPRTEVAFLDQSMVASAAAAKVIRLPHSRYPVVRGSADDVMGFVHVRDVLDPAVARTHTRMEKLVREMPRYPWSKRVLPTLQDMRLNQHHMGIVVDEFGGTAGIVTLEDLVEQLVGDIHDEYDQDDLDSDQPILLTGEVEVDGLDNLDEFAEHSMIELPDGPYETVAGYLMAALGRLPEVGDVVAAPGADLEVMELDGRRASRVRVRPLLSAAAPITNPGDDDAPGDRSMSE
ncbi:MAG: putative hemolysin [Actinomycetes bacterium]|jgi:putative hemolysin